MGAALFWGLVAGSSLVIGGLVALRWHIRSALLGLVMAFGAGVLISAVAYDLVDEAIRTTAGGGGVALGLAAGAMTFFVGDLLLEREVVVLDVRDDGGCAGQLDRGHGGDGSVRRRDHLVTGADAERLERDHERVRAVGDTDAAGHADVRRKLRFERRNLGPEYVAAAVEHALNRGVDPDLVREVLGPRIRAQDHSVCTFGT